MEKKPFSRMAYTFHLFSSLRDIKDNPHPLFIRELIPSSCWKKKGKKKNQSSSLIRTQLKYGLTSIRPKRRIVK
jgi:hypothetical protein